MTEGSLPENGSVIRSTRSIFELRLEGLPFPSDKKGSIIVVVVTVVVVTVTEVVVVEVIIVIIIMVTIKLTPLIS